MLKISYKDLRNDHFRNTMVKLANCAEYKDHKVAYNIMRMAKVLEQELSKTQKEWVTLGEKYIKKNDKGYFETASGEFVWLDEVDAIMARKALEEFGDKEVIIDRFKLKLDDIAPAKLSPADLAAIDPLITAGSEAALTQVQG